MSNVYGAAQINWFRSENMLDESKKDPCDHCKEQVTKSRHAAPHEHLRLLSPGRPYTNPYGMGGGVDSFYECELCGTKMFHSTDNYDFGWQL